MAIRTTVYPGVNAHQMAAIAEHLAELGATEMELVPFTPRAAADQRTTSGHPGAHGANR